MRTYGSSPGGVACPDREEIENADESDSESEIIDEVSVESFGENASNWDGSSSNEDSDHGDSDVGSSRSLIIDESQQSENVADKSRDKSENAVDVNIKSRVNIRGTGCQTSCQNQAGPFQYKYE